jgi:protein involved in polysaccharide export with SLBB domain
MEILKRWILLVVLLLLAGGATQAQELFYKKNLANIKVDQLTDEQVLRFRQQIETSNMSEKDLIRYFSGKGLSPQEINKLKARLGGFNNGSNTRDGKGSNVYESDLARAYYDLLDSLNMLDDQELLTGKFAKRKTLADSMVFGSELFANAKLAFAPDLKLAAPAGYVLGPGDELNIVIYGAHEASFDLVVSPEGRINVPFGGVVVVNGLSVEQASRKVSQLLQKNGISSLASGQSQLLMSLTDFRTIPVTVIGARVPGTYLMPAVANVFHALHAAGGPATHGTYREIEVIRKGKVIKTIDLYKFLTRGDDTDFIHVKENDVINIPVYGNRIAVKGEVKRPGLFELTSGESLESLMKYAGGFSELAFKESIQLIEIIDNERVGKRVAVQDFGSYVPGSGAVLEVSGVVNTVRSRVVASGAFMRPGSYAWENGMTLSALFEQAKGVENFALLNRGLVYRKAAATDAAYLRFDVSAVLAGKSDVVLEDGDSVVVADRLTLQTESQVLVLGKVQFEGPILFAEGMSANDAVLLAGGFAEDALKNKIEISRRQVDKQGRVSAVSFFESSDSTLSMSNPEKLLKPGDVVIVREDPSNKSQRFVTISGEVKYPGPYSLLSKGERLSIILKRAGGLTEFADPTACYIVRTTKNPFFNKMVEQKQMEASRSKLRLNSADDLFAGSSANPAVKTKTGPSRMPNMDAESLDLFFETSDSLIRDTISIDLKSVMGRFSDSKYDLILRNGDEIHVLEQRNTVAVRGEVNATVIVNHQSRRVKSYIKDAGGFSKNADKNRVFVLEPNGRSKMTRNFLGIRKYPSIGPGAEVVVPSKIYEERRSDPARMAAVASILASTTSVLFLVITLGR